MLKSSVSSSESLKETVTTEAARAPGTPQAQEEGLDCPPHTVRAITASASHTLPRSGSDTKAISEREAVTEASPMPGFQQIPKTADPTPKQDVEDQGGPFL